MTLMASTGQLMLAGFVILYANYPLHAQSPPPITSSGLNTQVTGPITIGGKSQYNVTGGIRPEGGSNLFHSFGEFGVPQNNIANFFNDTGLPTSNILCRVTGGNPSNIFGMVQMQGFDNANLYLMNPAGILFGPNASLNIGGSVVFTTANNFRLNDSAVFKALPGPADMLLSAAPVAAFGFLSSNPGDITVQASNLSVNPGQSINLVGGNILIQSPEDAPGAIQPVRLLAREGQINVVSVASAGEILASSFQPTSNITLGSIKLGPGTLVDVSGDAAGTVRIRGGTLIMDNAIISADTGDGNGTPLAVDIDIAGDASISSIQTSAVTARATGAGNAGEIRMSSAKLNVDFAFSGFGVVIDSSTVGSGNAGSITIATGELTALNNSSGYGALIDSGTGSPGNGGDVTIQVRRGTFTGANINTGDGLFFGTGSAGDLRIGGHDTMADSLRFESLVLSTEAFSAKAGAITLEGKDISISNNTFVSSISLQGENPITIDANRLSLDNVVRVQAQTSEGNGGDIIFRGRRLAMSNESAFITNTTGNGNAGSIRINASEYVRFADDPLVSTPSGLFTNSVGSESAPTSGNAGAIEVTTPRLELIGGARLSTTTRTAGSGGNVTVTASEGILASGQRGKDPPLENFGLGGSDGSGIFTRTIGTDQCGGICGRGGEQIITVGHLTLQDGGILDSGTTGNGNGGNIGITATKNILLSGTANDGTPSGVFSRTISQSPDAGSGGNITLNAGQSVAIRAGASISASSAGPGNAGNISINAGRQLDVRNGSITTKADKATGGNIDLRAIDRIRFVNSQVSASVGADSGDGGNITIDPNVVILQNSQVLAQAVQGHGGNITITTPLFLQDQRSLVDASSRFGVNGTVTIQSPTSNLSGTVKQLPSKPSDTQALLHNRCAAIAGGEQSTFILAGRDALPSEPGGWLSSPMAVQTGTGHGHEGLSRLIERKVGWRDSSAMIAQVAESKVLSLRRLTPPGFLVRSFAVTGSEGCHS